MQWAMILGWKSRSEGFGRLLCILHYATFFDHSHGPLQRYTAATSTYNMDRTCYIITFKLNKEHYKSTHIK